MAKLIYQCKHCAGTVYYRVTTENIAMAAMHSICYDLPQKKQITKFNKSIIHKCNETHYGVADFIGIETTQQFNNKEKA